MRVADAGRFDRRRFATRCRERRGETITAVVGRRRGGEEA
jgi:hypothetical protein